jgi:hypothetical protein
MQVAMIVPGSAGLGDMYAKDPLKLAVHSRKPMQPNG